MNDTSNTGVNSTGIVDNNAAVTPVTPVTPAPVSTPPAEQVNVESVSTVPVASPEPVLSAPETPASPLNLEDRISSVSVVETPTVQSTESAPASVPTSTPEVKPETASEEVPVPTEEPHEEESKKETKKEEGVPEGEINKAPIVIVIIFVLLLVLLLVYYFVIMTPRHVFETAIDDTVSAIGDAITSIKNSDTDDINLKFDFDMSTFNDNITLERLRGVERLDGEQFKSNISLDLNKGNYLITLSAERANDYSADNKKFYAPEKPEQDYLQKGTKIAPNKKYASKETGSMVLDTSFYSFDGNMFMYPKYYYNDNNGQGVNAYPPYDAEPYWLYVNGDINDYDARAKKIRAVQKDLDDKKITTHEANMKIDEIETYYGKGKEVLESIDDERSRNQITEEEAKERKDAVTKQMASKNIGSKGTIVQADVIGLYAVDNLATDLNIDKIKDMYNFADRVKSRIQKELRDDQLHRTIALKKINQNGKDTTAVALKVHCKLNNEEIAKIYKTIFGDWVDEYERTKDNSEIKELSMITGASQDDIYEEIKRLLEREVVTQDIDVNLYMNLANTQLISLDVTVDNKYHAELSLLNGYYTMRFYINADNREDKEDKIFDIQATYDNDNGIVDGVGYIHANDDDKKISTYIIVDFYYKRREDESGKKDGNELILTFYDGPKNYDGGPEFEEDPSTKTLKPIIKDKPFAQLMCKLDLEKNVVLDEFKEFDDYITKNNGNYPAYAIPNVVSDEEYNERKEAGEAKGYYSISEVNTFLSGFQNNVYLTIEDIVKTSVSQDKLLVARRDGNTVYHDISLPESIDLLKFQMGFLEHIDFLVDHLLRLEDEDYKVEPGTMPLRYLYIKKYIGNSESEDKKNDTIPKPETTESTTETKVENNSGSSSEENKEESSKDKDTTKTE